MATDAQPLIRVQRPKVSRIVLGGRRVGDLDRPRARGSVREAVGDVGRLRQGVGHLVGRQRAGHLVREEPVVLLVARHGRRRQRRRPPRWRSSGSGRGGRTCARRSAGPGRRAARDGPAGSTGSRSSGGSAIPLPKNWAQTQLAIARAKYGLSGEVIQSASGLARVLGLGDLDRLAGRAAGARRACLVRRCSTCPLGSILTIGPVHHRRRPAAGALDLGEEGGQAEVVVLGPDVERVVVALGAADPEAEEPLGGLLGRTLASGPSRA